MKRQYVKPTVRCITLKSSSTLLQATSLATSEQKTTRESYSRQTDDFDDWEE